MAIYLITGKLGAGKTLAAVGRIRDVLLEGRRVATNLDLRLERLLPDTARKVSCVRLPDKPCVDDLEAIGIGNESMDESRNGVIVLDELGAWLNARQWADKSRQAVIDWLIHSRKKGWDVYFIAQSAAQVDKQVRESLIEYLVVCRRLDRMRMPVVGGLLRSLSGGWVSGNLPRVHVAIVRYGTAHDSIVADRWVYLGADLYGAYDTRQVFSETYKNGVYAYLPPWHVEGWRWQSSALREAFVRVLPGLASVWPRREVRGARARSVYRPVPAVVSRALALAARLPRDEAWKHARRILAAADAARSTGAAAAGGRRLDLKGGHKRTGTLQGHSG